MMQSTLNTAPVFRPKVGRPPEPVAAQAAGAAEGPMVPRWNAKLLVFSLALVAAMTLVLSRMLTPALPEESALAPIPPLVKPAPEIVSPGTPAAMGAPIVGTVTMLGESTDSASPRPAQMDAPQSPIDNEDRERLLSILSDD